MMKQCLTALLAICTLNVVHAQVPNDVYRLESVSRPKIAPEGNWILYSQSKIDSPEHLKVVKDKLFAVSGITIEMTKGERKLERITKGSNCIFVVSFIE